VFSKTKDNKPGVPACNSPTLRLAEADRKGMDLSKVINVGTRLGPLSLESEIPENSSTCSPHRDQI